MPLPGTPGDLRPLIGHEVGTSEWVRITQDMIDRFADLTDDHQYIHVDPQRAALTHLGGTVAHGFLVLSLLGRMSAAAEISLAGTQMRVNYGFDRIRLLAPVRPGSRIRGVFQLKDLIERDAGQWLTTLTVTIEIEGEAKPAAVAQWLILQQ
jgi:acyl dehydratase